MNDAEANSPLTLVLAYGFDSVRENSSPSAGGPSRIEVFCLWECLVEVVK